MPRTCSICGLRGSKGWFSVPNESDPTHRQWLNVINEPVTEQSRVCFHHFEYKDLGLTLGGYATFEPGKLNDIPRPSASSVNLEKIDIFAKKSRQKPFEGVHIGDGE